MPPCSSPPRRASFGAFDKGAPSFFPVLTMTREKRSVPVKAHITPSMRQELEQLVAEEGTVVSISDFLFGMIEERVAMKAIRITRPRLGKRIGQQ